LGETGTGKSLIAKNIHKISPISNHQFLTVNLASLNENLIESELFGHTKGSFTGAINDSVGFCEKVGQGTLFLDEIGELSPSSQKKLLYLLEEKEYCQVGARRPKRFQGRIIAATNLSLEALVLKGHFRKDLYYRLCTFQIDMPPLRENKKLIDELIPILIKKYKNESMNFDFSLSEDCINFFYKYRWPGNIRELKSCLQYLIYSYNNEVTLRELPKWIDISKKTIVYDDLSFHNARSIFEKKLLISALNKYGGRINFTALKLGISKVTLIAKIKKYDINTSEIKYKASLSKIGKNEF